MVSDSLVIDDIYGIMWLMNTYANQWILSRPGHQNRVTYTGIRTSKRIIVDQDVVQGSYYVSLGGEQIQLNKKTFQMMSASFRHVRITLERIRDRDKPKQSIEQNIDETINALKARKEDGRLTPTQVAEDEDIQGV